jgi:predicted metal-dependent hydrolase
LTLAPAEVFRYVVIHELAHLRHRNHGPRFWSLVERQMPDFDLHRRWLREHGAALHAVLA